MEQHWVAPPSAVPAAVGTPAKNPSSPHYRYLPLLAKWYVPSSRLQKHLQIHLASFLLAALAGVAAGKNPHSHLHFCSHPSAEDPVTLLHPLHHLRNGNSALVGSLAQGDRTVESEGGRCWHQ